MKEAFVSVLLILLFILTFHHLYVLENPPKTDPAEDVYVLNPRALEIDYTMSAPESEISREPYILLDTTTMHINSIIPPLKTR